MYSIVTIVNTVCILEIHEENISYVLFAKKKTKQNKKLCEVMDVLIILTVGIMSQCTCTVVLPLAIASLSAVSVTGGPEAADPLSDIIRSTAA